ncbi:MAG: oxidase [Acidobacteria bacterium]|nr:oxidase [Acidobacteriota bacterium]
MSAHSEHHVVPVKVYLAIFGALMVGTALTVFVAQFNFGVLNVLIALTVACIKATLVILFFMHVAYSSRLTKVVIGAGIFWFAILIFMTITDYRVRQDWHVGLGSLEKPAAEQPAAPQPSGSGH